MTKVIEFDSENYLAHHGVLGMHWGQRNAETLAKEGPSSKEKRKAKNQEILDARTRQADRETKAEDRYIAKRNELHAAYVAGKKAVDSSFNKSFDKVLTHPDADTAAKMTTGEKWSTAAALTALGIGAITYGTIIAKL